MNALPKTAILAGAVAMASSVVTALALSSTTATAAATQPAADVAAPAPGFLRVADTVSAPSDFTEASESTINGVVSIKSYTSSTSAQGSMDADPYSNPLYEFFFGTPAPRRQQRDRQQRQPQERQRGLGSGVILSADGYIVTNNHVIDGADRLEVTLNDNRIFNATLVGTDATTDVALLKIEAEGLHVIPIGNSDELRVGEWVLAVGNPFGFTSTVTTGIVSAKARSVGAAAYGRPMGIESYIQTDAAVNPGNSGGALVNTRGELVGINTAIYSGTGSYVGYSFAIPSAIVTKVVTDIKQFGTVQRAVLGIAFTELTPQLARDKGITAVNDGILVGEVMDRSAAMAAGIEPGDVVVAINGSPTHNTAQLQGEISKYSPGDEITLDYVRQNTRHTARVTLQNQHGDTSVTKASDFSALGCALGELSAERLSQFRLGSGVEVKAVEPDGKFAAAGIRQHFIILDINGSRVRSPKDVESIYNALMRSTTSDRVMFITGIYPTGRKVYYAVDLTD